MLERHVGRWRGQVSNPALGGLVELSINHNRTCTVRLGRTRRFRELGFPRDGGSGVTLEFEARGELDTFTMKLEPAITGILRSAVRGHVGGVPVDESFRLLKISSAP